MLRFNISLLLFVLFALLKGSASVSLSGRKLLNSLKEYHLFKPVFSIHGNLFNVENTTFSTLLSEADGSHVPELSVLFTANGTKYHLQLTLNEGLIPEGFSVSYLGGGKNGDDVYEEPTLKEINNCYYHGRVVGVENSQVVASTCHGLEGTIFLPDDLLQFSPIDEYGFMHVLHRPQDLPEHQCGTHHFKQLHKTMTATEAMLAPIRLRRAAEEKKFIELLFVADYEESKHFKDRVTLNEHVKKILNHMDALYKLLDLRVVLLHLEVWESGDKISSNSDAQQVLYAFLDYRREKIQNSPKTSPWRYTDNAQLLYGSSFDGSTVGMATVSSMCSLRSGGVNEDKKNALGTAATIAHEMGHNLGMSHDTTECKCSGSRCVMAATTGAVTPGAWTDCSMDYLQSGYEHGTATCLLNVPDSTKLFGGPKCGNGIVETGEQCDCGLPEECESKCCNATTCQLHEEAHCDYGACCTEDCHFKTSCSVCRDTANNCDITEYCTGYSAHCPGNIHKMDGTDCGAGVCYGGICRTHEMQCREIWGPDARNGEDQCYRSVNKKGNSNGNCGKEGGSFKPCADENVKCGKLLCMGGKQYPAVASDRVFFKNKFKNYVCKTLSSINETSDTDDPGVVWDGTKCGEGKMCFNGICSNISEVLKPCKVDCHGNGICNNFGNCHCNAGWAPPDCSRKGNGGSADSGSICASTVELQVILMLVFFLVVLPIILGFMSFVWWRYCGGKQKVYAWRKNRARRENAGAGHMSEPRFSDIPEKPTKPPTSFGVSRPPPPASNAYISRLNAPPTSRPPPPARPSPRLPVRQAPPTPTKKPTVVPQKPNPPASNVPRKPNPPTLPQKPTQPAVAFRRGPETNNTNNCNPTSIQARIAQLQGGNRV